MSDRRWSRRDGMPPRLRFAVVICWSRTGEFEDMGSLTPELSEEINRLLGRSTIRHGQAFRGMRDGRRAEQMARDWCGKTVPYVRSVMRSVQYILDGELPTGSAMAYENSFGYRELWELGPSPALLAYVKARLSELQDINPAVSMSPMGPVSFPGETARNKRRMTTATCSRCFLQQPCDCD